MNIVFGLQLYMKDYGGKLIVIELVIVDNKVLKISYVILRVYIGIILYLVCVI